MPVVRTLLAAAAVALVLAVAPPAALSATNETLSNFKISGASSARAGTVTFRVVNRASMEHELVVLRTRTPAAKLPVHGGRASERGKVGEVEVAAGKAKRLRLHLRRGHYVLICNFKGHVMAGMRRDFTVR